MFLMRRKEGVAVDGTGLPIHPDLFETDLPRRRPPKPFQVLGQGPYIEPLSAVANTTQQSESKHLNLYRRNMYLNHHIETQTRYGVKLLIQRSSCTLQVP